VTSFQWPKEVTKKGRSLLKFLTAQKAYFMGANRVVATNVSIQLSLKWLPARRPLAIFP
jgi:hypothetical protein